MKQVVLKTTKDIAYMKLKLGKKVLIFKNLGNVKNTFCIFQVDAFNNLKTI